jgi:hypothetical protein
MTTVPETYTVWSTSLSTLQDGYGGKGAKELCIADVLDVVVSNLSPTSLVGYVSLERNLSLMSSCCIAAKFDNMGFRHA